MSNKIFEGIKVAEFAWVVVGPSTSRYLADHGATVVRIESHTHIPMLRGASPFLNNVPGLNRSMFYGKYNANKYGATLDLNHHRGRELAWRFIKWADIVIESFRPGAMKKWGLDYENVSKIRPDIIYLSTSMQGQTGPFSQYAGVGSMIAAVAGFGEISGWPDRMPSPPYGAYSDFFCQRFNSVALIAALDYRDRTGKGQWIEQSQLETSIQMIAPLIMDYAINAKIAGRSGNRLSYAAPHGVYPCRGMDRWIAISVFDDSEWQRFCDVIGNPDWTADLKFATLVERKRNEDELDDLLAKWTLQYTAEEIEASMQSKRVRASIVQKNSDVYEDEQLRYRCFFKRLKHPEMGEPAYPQQANYIASRVPRDLTLPSPCMGEHNLYVYKELLGMTEDEIADHIADGSITTSLPPGYEIRTHL